MKHDIFSIYPWRRNRAIEELAIISQDNTRDMDIVTRVRAMTVVLRRLSKLYPFNPKKPFDPVDPDKHPVPLHALYTLTSSLGQSETHASLMSATFEITGRQMEEDSGIAASIKNWPDDPGTEEFENLASVLTLYQSNFADLTGLRVPPVQLRTFVESATGDYGVTRRGFFRHNIRARKPVSAVGINMHPDAKTNKADIAYGIGTHETTHYLDFVIACIEKQLGRDALPSGLRDDATMLRARFEVCAIIPCRFRQAYLQDRLEINAWNQQGRMKNRVDEIINGRAARYTPATP